MRTPGYYRYGSAIELGQLPTLPSTIPPVLPDWWNTPVNPNAPPGLPAEPPALPPNYYPPAPPTLPKQEDKTDWAPIATIVAAVLVAGALVLSK